MSVISSETWSFPARVCDTAVLAACVGPHRSADNPEQALKWDLWCCHQPFCTDNTLCGCDGCRPRPVPEHLFCPLACWLVCACHTRSIYMHLCFCLCTCLHMYLLVSFFLPLYLYPLSLSLHLTLHLRILVMPSVSFLVWSCHLDLKGAVSVIPVVSTAPFCHQL